MDRRIGVEPPGLTTKRWIYFNISNIVMAMMMYSGYAPVPINHNIRAHLTKGSMDQVKLIRHFTANQEEKNFGYSLTKVFRVYIMERERTED